MNTDDHDIRKSEIEDRAIHAAEDAAQVAAFGKAAFEAYAKELEKTGLAEKYGMRISQWSDVAEDYQCSWVNIAQAVLKEAQRVGWMFPV